MLRKLQFLCFVCVLSFVSGLVNSSFADFEEKLKDAGEINGGGAAIIDNTLIEEEPVFPTREGPEWTQEFGDLRWAPNFIFGPAQFEKMRNLPRNSQDYQLGTKVAYFRARGLWICTGFLVGPDLVMTNAHCLPSDISRIEICMAYYQEPSVDPTRGGVHARVTEVLRFNQQLDYALLRLDTPIGNTYGWLTLDETAAPQPGQSVKLIHHSAGRSKEISRQDSEIIALDDPRPYLLAYIADTEGGTSGCPVFMRDGADSTSVIAINWGGIYRDINRNRRYDPGIDIPICNVGNLMSYIVPQIRQWLPTTPPPSPPPTPQPPPPSSDDQMYWTDAGTDKIQRANLDGTNDRDLVTTGLQSPWGIAVDTQGGKMYWTDAGTNKIQRANLDGTNRQDLVTGLDKPWGIAVDTQARKIYWTDAGTNKIQRANLDGTGAEIIISNLDNPDGIALDVQARKMYWTDYGTDKIQRANLDGTNVEDLVTRISSPFGIALDVQARKMYWTDAGRDKIQRANFDGTYIEDLVTTGLSLPEDIVLDVRNNKMYWTDWGSDKIQRANLDGTGVQDLIAIGLEQPIGIALKISQVRNPLTFNPSTVPNQTFTVGTPVSLTLPTAAGGTAPYSYSLAPSLPLGLSFVQIGSGPGIGGTPTTITPINTYTYSARDSAGASGRLTFTIRVIRNKLDVNGDGVINVADLVLVAMAYGRRAPAGTDLAEDVNSDSVVNLLDLTLVANAIDAASGANAPAISDIEEVAAAANALSGGNIAYRNVAAALADAQLEEGVPETLLKALQHLLIEMERAKIPESTALLPNYPNPFNPETWIPYHLAEDADVTVKIHDVRGSVVRELVLGHQAAGVYESRGRAAYWDGKNQLGEPVASGVYFYTLTAGDFTATRKLLIAK